MMTAKPVLLSNSSLVSNTKLFKVLQKFDKYEQNRLRKFISSPYFNQDKTLIKLFDQILESIKIGKKRLLSKAEIWSFIQDKKTYDDTRFRKYCSDLLKLIEKYLIQEIFEKDESKQAALLIEAVGQKGMNEMYSTTLRKARHALEKQTIKSAEFYYDTFEVEKKYYHHILSRDNSADLNRKQGKNFEEIMLNLDRYYFAEKLRYYCEILAWKNEFSRDYKVQFIPEITAQVRRMNADQITPPEAIYYQMYLTISESENESHFNKLKKLLDQHIHLFPKEEVIYLYRTALNYCVWKINKGIPGYLNEYFEINKILLEKELLFNGGLINPFEFKNIVLIALRLGKFNWTESFIENYKDRLPLALKENAVTYNLATLYFYQKDYSKVIEQLQNVEYEDLVYNFNSKSMLIGSYYELDEIEPLYSLFESFRAYLNRHKDIPEQKRKFYLNLIKFTKRLTRIIPGDTKAIDKLKKDIETSEGVASLKWLKEKIAELEEK